MGIELRGLIPGDEPIRVLSKSNEDKGKGDQVQYEYERGWRREPKKTGLLL